jgi:hypothetical protein
LRNDGQASSNFYDLNVTNLNCLRLSHQIPHQNRIIGLRFVFTSGDQIITDPAHVHFRIWMLLRFFKIHSSRFGWKGLALVEAVDAEKPENASRQSG